MKYIHIYTYKYIDIIANPVMSTRHHPVRKFSPHFFRHATLRCHSSAGLSEQRSALEKMGHSDDMCMCTAHAFPCMCMACHLTAHVSFCNWIQITKSRQSGLPVQRHPSFGATPVATPHLPCGIGLRRFVSILLKRQTAVSCT